MLAKKRNQSKRALIEMVDFFLNSLLPKMRDNEVEVLLKSMAETCEGKIFLEQQYAKCIRRLTDRAMQRGEIDAAGLLIQDIQIETFGSVPKNEKLEYILYQLEIMLLKKDYVRAMIVAGKVDEKNLEAEKVEELKIKYYQLMIVYHVAHENYDEISRCYRAIFNFLKKVKGNLETLGDSLPTSQISTYSTILDMNDFSMIFANFVVSLCLCEPKTTKHGIFLKVSEEYKKDLADFPHLGRLISLFTRTDINFVGTDPMPAAKGIDFIANQPERYNILIRRLLEHNLQIFGEYFSRVSVHKISSLLGVAKDNLEEITASMVVKKQLFAKINRINQIISFRKKEDIQEQLEKTNRNVEEMLEKIDNTCHLIHKENLKYSIK